MVAVSLDEEPMDTSQSSTIPEPIITAPELEAPSLSTRVFKDECMFCFHSPFFEGWLRFLKITNFWLFKVEFMSVCNIMLGCVLVTSTITVITTDVNTFWEYKSLKWSHLIRMSQRTRYIIKSGVVLYIHKIIDSTFVRFGRQRWGRRKNDNCGCA